MPSAVVQKYPPRFNSLQLQFANMALSFGGTTYFTNLSEVAYSDTCEKGEARGISPLPMGVTQGEYKAQGSFSVHLIAWPDLQKILASQSPDGNSIYDAMFDISIQWAAKASPGQPQPAVQTHVLQSCFITGTDLSSSAGNAPVMVKCTLYVPYISWNGYLPLSGVEQGSVAAPGTLG